MTKNYLKDRMENLELEACDKSKVHIPHKEKITHLQFRRFAGCPMCNLHLNEFRTRHHELVAKGIQEVVVFHSSQTKIQKAQIKAPFFLVGDKSRNLYAMFGVKRSLLSVLNPVIMVPAIKGLIKHGLTLPELGESLIGLPADFLIHSDGRVVASKHGVHAYDQWSVDEVLSLAECHRDG